MAIHLEKEFRRYLHSQGIKRDYISNLNAILTYTSVMEISPETLPHLSNLEDLQTEIIANRKGIEPAATPEAYVRDCISALRKYMQFTNSLSSPANVWVMALGDNGSNIDANQRDSIISIGWHELGNLRQYPTKEAIGQQLAIVRPAGSATRTNTRLGCYEFANRMQVGDLLFIRRTVSDIIGYGFVTGDYEHNASRGRYPNIRKFNWVARGNWQLKYGQHSQKTLTEISKDYPQTVIQLKNLVGLTETAIIYPDTLPENEVYEEGSRLTTVVNAYERNPAARQRCIEAHKAICKVCDFDFEKTYGDIGRGFIHVHHLKELRDIGQKYQVDPVKHLAPVCPNCHAMLHKNRPAYSIEELKAIISKQSK